MRLSEHNSLYKNRYWFLRFGDEKSHLESIQNGTLRFGSGAYYKKIEEEQGKKGVGDRYEASVVFGEADIIIPHPVTGESLARVPIKESIITLPIPPLLPVFCLYAFNGDDLEVVSEDEKTYYVRLVLNEQDKQSLQKDFGEHVLIILNSTLFIRRVVEGMQQMQQRPLKVSNGLVRYDDFSKYGEERWASYKEDERNVLFWKDERDFKHQKEYRIIVTNALITEPTFYNIGDMNDITSYMTREQLFTEGLKIKITKEIS